MIERSDSIVSKSVFIFSISIIAFSLISVVFPALVVRSTSGASFSNIDPFELGLFAVPFIVSNSLFFITFILYQKNKLLPINRILDFLKEFDINKSKSLLILLAILSVYVGFSYGELFEAENIPDRSNVIAQLETWHTGEKLVDKISHLHTNLFFLTASEFIFHNMRVIPFLFSVLLLILTYFFTNKLTSKNYTGLVSVVIVIQSFIFREFDSVITYSNFWVFFYVLSLFLVYRAWPLSSLAFIASFFAKSITIAYVPFSLFYILSNTQKKKILIIMPYILILVAASLFFLVIAPQSPLQNENFIFHPPKFFSGFTTIPYQLRYDLFIMMALLPVSFLLYKKSRQGHKQADFIQLVISGVFLTGSIMVGILDYQLNPYRLQPMIVFFAIGVGLLFSNKIFGHNQLPS